MIKKKMMITLNTEQSDYVELSANSPIPMVESEREDEIEHEKTELFTEGTLEISRDGKFVLSYDESKLTNAPFSITSVHFEKSNPNLVTLMRTGEFRLAMVFEPDTRHICVYETPYMPIEMCIATHSLKNTLSERGGCLRVRYSIETNGMRCEMARIDLVVQPQED